jgi:hypothetical protein
MAGIREPTAQGTVSYFRRIIALIERTISLGRQIAWKDIGRWRIYDRSSTAVRVLVAAPQTGTEPESDVKLPDALRRAVKTLRDQLPAESGLRPLMRLGANGVYVEAVLKDSSGHPRPPVLLVIGPRFLVSPVLVTREKRGFC